MSVLRELYWDVLPALISLLMLLPGHSLALGVSQAILRAVLGDGVWIRGELSCVHVLGAFLHRLRLLAKVLSNLQFPSHRLSFL